MKTVDALRCHSAHPATTIGGFISLKWEGEAGSRRFDSPQDSSTRKKRPEGLGLGSSTHIRSNGQLWIVCSWGADPSSSDVGSF